MFASYNVTIPNIVYLTNVVPYPENKEQFLYTRKTTFIRKYILPLPPTRLIFISNLTSLSYRLYITEHGAVSVLISTGY